MEKGPFIVDMPRRRQSRRSRKSRRSTKRRRCRTQQGGYGFMPPEPEVEQYFNEEGAAIMGKAPKKY
jgi:hypothetical protein